jgi:SNF2 family DNA or RNA helicase
MLTQRTDKMTAAARIILKAISDPSPFSTSDMALAENPTEMTHATNPIQLRPHQLEAVGRGMHLENMYKGFILGDEPGLGKTYTVIGLILSKPTSLATLVVAPGSLINTWKKELEKFFSEGEVCFFNHKMAGVRTAQLEKCRVVLASYEIIAVEFGRLGKWHEGAIHRRNELKGIDAETGKGEGSSKPDRAAIWTLPDIPLIEATYGRVVLDEGHRIRNQGEVQVFKHVMRLKAEYRVVCTGTRLHNSYDDMLAYLLFLRIFPWNDEEFFARVR